MDLHTYRPIRASRDELRELATLNGRVVTALDPDGISAPALFLIPDALMGRPGWYDDEASADTIDAICHGTDEEWRARAEASRLAEADALARRDRVLAGRRERGLS